jgi:small subunit ribosomal protein S15
MSNLISCSSFGHTRQLLDSIEGLKKSMMLVSDVPTTCFANRFEVNRTVQGGSREERIRIMKQEAEEAMSTLYSRFPEVYKRLRFLGNPDINFNWTAIEKYEADLLKRLEAKADATLCSDINDANRQLAIEKWRRHYNDTGSSEVQVALAHERIKYLTTHMLAHKHDESAKRGLHALVTQRRISLQYLYRTNATAAWNLVKNLGIRFVPPDRHLFDKSIRYSAFKNTKSTKIIGKRKRSK